MGRGAGRGGEMTKEGEALPEVPAGAGEGFAKVEFVRAGGELPGARRHGGFSLSLPCAMLSMSSEHKFAKDTVEANVENLARLADEVLYP